MIHPLLALNFGQNVQLIMLGFFVTAVGCFMMWAYQSSYGKKLKAWAQSRKCDLLEPQQIFSSHYFEKKASAYFYKNIIQSQAGYKLAEYTYQQLIGESFFEKSQTVFVFEHDQLNFPNCAIHPMTLTFHLEESLEETTSNFKFKELFASEHVLLTDHYAQIKTFLTDDFSDLMEEYEDFYIEFSENKILICKPELTANTEDLDEFVHQCKALISQFDQVKEENLPTAA